MLAIVNKSTLLLFFCLLRSAGLHLSILLALLALLAQTLEKNGPFLLLGVGQPG